MHDTSTGIRMSLRGMPVPRALQELTPCCHCLDIASHGCPGCRLRSPSCTIAHAWVCLLQCQVLYKLGGHTLFVCNASRADLSFCAVLCTERRTRQGLRQDLFSFQLVFLEPNHPRPWLVSSRLRTQHSSSEHASATQAALHRPAGRKSDGRRT